MADYRGMERRLTEILGLQRRPVAVTFRDTPPAGVRKFTGTEPSGCSFWRISAGGRTFYTSLWTASSGRSTGTSRQKSGRS